MAYSNFTLEKVQRAFQLEIVESTGIFSTIVGVVPSAHLTTTLERNVELAAAINTEKAKSEMIVADILIELREHFKRGISIFSGIEFSVDADNDLRGVCDFLVSLSPIQAFLAAPVIAVVEAKKDDLTGGFGRCAAEMVAAQRFNAERDNDVPYVYGTTTSGTVWQFLKLDRSRLHLDRTDYTIAQCDKILGILASMVEQKV